MKNIVLLCSILIFFGCTGQEREIEYGSISVPENRSKEDSRTIDISYVRIPSLEDRGRPPIIFLQGGPGGNSLYMAPFFMNNSLRTMHDIILFDARGTGKSEAYCADAGKKFLSLMRDDLTIEEEYNRTVEVCDQCKKELEENEVDLAGYNSMENAADVEALRKHLGIDTWILFGGSYGTKLGLTYLREYNSAEAAVFMGLFPLEVNIHEGFLGGLNGALERVFTLCADDESCNGKYPDLKSSFISLMEQLEEKPLEVNYQGSPFVLNKQDVLLLIHQMLYQRVMIRKVPGFIHACLNKSEKEIAVAINRTAQTMNVINVATYWSVMANEEHFNKPNAIVEDLVNYPHLSPGPSFFANDQEVLSLWHSFRADDIENEPVYVETPLLIVNGLFDPITPPSNARNALEYLPNASLVEFPYDGHAFYSTCFFNLVEYFVASGYDKIQDPKCAQQGSINWE